VDMNSNGCGRKSHWPVFKVKFVSISLRDKGVPTEGVWTGKCKVTGKVVPVHN
jgi:hypothetical protein